MNPTRALVAAVGWLVVAAGSFLAADALLGDRAATVLADIDQAVYDTAAIDREDLDAAAEAVAVGFGSGVDPARRASVFETPARFLEPFAVIDALAQRPLTGHRVTIVAVAPGDRPATLRVSVAITATVPRPDPEQVTDDTRALGNTTVTVTVVHRGTRWLLSDRTGCGLVAAFGQDCTQTASPAGPVGRIGEP